MSKDFKAIIRPESTRYQEWMNAFGANEVSIKSPIPHEGSAPGIERGLFYLIDLEELTGEQKERLVKHLASKFNIDEQEVASQLVECPIYDEDVAVVIHNPQKWLQ